MCPTYAVTVRSAPQVKLEAKQGAHNALIDACEPPWPLLRVLVNPLRQMPNDDALHFAYFFLDADLLLLDEDFLLGTVLHIENADTCRRCDRKRQRPLETSGTRQPSMT